MRKVNPVRRVKLEKNLGSIADLRGLPSAIFVVDILKEHIAVAEARKLNIPIFAMVDTNSNPLLVDFPIPSNDDASKSIALIVKLMADAIEEGLSERRMDKEQAEIEEAEEAEEKARIASLEALEDEEEKDLASKPIKAHSGEEEEEEGSKGKRPRKVITKKR